ncbi:hypothetical protein TNCV_3778141 [Trichonephila clavipes]|nr:hypothetical protein TNCV_3778141 [Trichonephila clavipes]
MCAPRQVHALVHMAKTALNKIGLALCKLCDSNEKMDAIHLACCPAQLWSHVEQILGGLIQNVWFIDPCFLLFVDLFSFLFCLQLSCNPSLEIKKLHAAVEIDLYGYELVVGVIELRVRNLGPPKSLHLRGLMYIISVKDHGVELKFRE